MVTRAIAHDPSAGGRRVPTVDAQAAPHRAHAFDDNRPVVAVLLPAQSLRLALTIDQHVLAVEWAKKRDLLAWVDATIGVQVDGDALQCRRPAPREFGPQRTGFDDDRFTVSDGEGAVGCGLFDGGGLFDVWGLFDVRAELQGILPTRQGQMKSIVNQRTLDRAASQVAATLA